MPKFRNPLPEDRLSERERDERIRMLDEFSKKLKKERKRAGIDDRTAIRQMLIYVGKRLDLLDLENRHARALAQYDSLLGRTAKPVPQDLIGVATDAVLDFGLKDREKMIRSHEGRTESLIAEISLLAQEIDRLLDQRQSPDKENYVLRPSSCLPEVAVRDEEVPAIAASTPELPKDDGPQSDTACEAPKTGEQSTVEADLVDKATADIGRNKDQSKRHDFSQSNNPKGRLAGPTPTQQPSNKRSSREWLEPRKSTITVHGKPYGRNHLADKLMQCDYFTERQRDAAVLWHGYDMRDVAISVLLHCKPKTVYDHRKGADSKIAKDPTMQVLLRNYNRRIRRSKEEEDLSRPE